ncbi:MAG: adenylosuccinate synthase [Candidatus Kerfeldbacteria bacterium]|nr:adenylosuccinate synthase [Candidatus Kerfeldbacteria bacterium]
MKTRSQALVWVVVGAQWGDEGKGKLVHLLSRLFALVVRYQGGANAGHTVKVKQNKYVFHLIPSGIIRRFCLCLLGNGTVIDPEVLLEEVKSLERRGICVRGRLLIATGAHLITPWLLKIEQARSAYLGKRGIGTTGRAIGPAYEYKMARVGIRAGAVRSSNLLKLLYKSLAEANRELRSRRQKPVSRSEARKFARVAKKLAPFLVDCSSYLNQEWQRGRKILLEGAQGGMLDVDHGTYPYVTSSSPTAGGACTGTGLPPTAISGILGVIKAYATRVGGGPFVTEIGDTALAERIRQSGDEYGATTGRPRRVGWLDLPQLRRTIAVSGIQALAMTKADVLDGLDEVLVCTSYRCHGRTWRVAPLELHDIQACRPQYKRFRGWSGVSGQTNLRKLHPNFRRYVEFVARELGAPIVFTSTGAKEHETVVCRSKIPANFKLIKELAK